MVVQEYKIGNTTIQMDDSYIIHDKKEIEKILKQIAKIQIVDDKKDPQN